MSASHRRRRSVLYVPASNAKAMAKAGDLACDAIIYDLEDAVAPDAKAAARSALLEHFRNGASAGRQERIIRINARGRMADDEDLDAASRCRPDSILLPKVERPEMLMEARRTLDAAGGAEIRLWAMVETPLGIVNLRDIAAAAASVGLDCLVAGVNDLAKDTGVPMPAGRSTIRHWLAAIVLHARAFGLDVIDGVYNDFRDIDRFVDECHEATAAGFDGKTLIHPSQIAPANAAFSPTPETLAEARAVIAAFDDPANAAEGVLVVNGRMVERLHADTARRLLTRQDG